MLVGVRRSRTWLLFLWALVVACSSATGACGGKGARSARGDDPEGPIMIEYVPIAIAWVRRNVGTNPEEVKAWAASPEGQAAASTEIRHVLVRVRDGARPKEIAAAKKRADEILARLDAGEDASKLARELSDDAATKAKGGALGSDPSALEDKALRDATQKLAPGDRLKQPLRSARGFHVVTRDAIDDKALRAAYQKAKTPELARRLTEELLSRMRASNAPLDDIAKETYAAVLGDAAAHDEKAHPAVRVSREQAGGADVPEDAKEALAAFARKAKPGDVVDSALGTGPVLVVARAVASK